MLSTHYVSLNKKDSEVIPYKLWLVECGMRFVRSSGHISETCPVIHKRTGSDLQMNVGQSCVFHRRKYICSIYSKIFLVYLWIYSLFCCICGSLFINESPSTYLWIWNDSNPHKPRFPNWFDPRGQWWDVRVWWPSGTSAHQITQLDIAGHRASSHVWRHSNVLHESGYSRVIKKTRFRSPCLVGENVDLAVSGVWFPVQVHLPLLM